MTPLAAAAYLAILLSTALGVYLRLRQISGVSAGRAAVPADFTGTVTLDEHRRAADYTIAATRLGVAAVIFEALVSLAWLFLFLAPFYSVIVNATSPGLTRSVILVAAFSILGVILDLPASLARVFWLDARFGFNRQNLSGFIKDLGKTTALELALSVPALYAIFALLQAAPQTWHFYAFVGFFLLFLAITAIYPTLIAPLFNSFVPLSDEPLRDRLETLLHKCGFASKGLFVMDASKRSSRGNAYFAGIGKNKRIVLFDTLLEKHTPHEIESILAHELGHYKYGHIRQMLLLFAAFSFFGFLGLHWALSPFGLTRVFGLPADPGLALIAALLVKEPVMHLLLPLLGWRSRKAEFEADAFAGDMVGTEPMISALTRLTRDNLATLTPDHLYAQFYYSHPPVPLRVAKLRASKPA